MHYLVDLQCTKRTKDGLPRLDKNWNFFTYRYFRHPDCVDCQTRLRNKNHKQTCDTCGYYIKFGCIRNAKHFQNCKKYIAEKSCGTDDSEERVFLGDDKVDVGEDVTKWSTVSVAKDFQFTKKVKLGSNPFSDKCGPKKSCSSQQTMDAYVRVTKNVLMDTSANVSAMTLNSLTKDLVTCVNCKREWDGYAQCPCWYDNYNGENQENELHCEEERVYVPKDRNIVKKKANPLDVIYSVFKNYGIVNEETYKYSLGRDKEVQNVTGKYAYQLQKLKHLCFDGLLSERNAILFTDRVKAREVALNELTDELQKYVLSTAWGLL